MPNEQRLINPHKMFTGNFIPNWLMERREISNSEKLLYSILHTYESGTDKFYASQGCLADGIGISERQIRRCLNNLEKVGLIKIYRKGRKLSNIYSFLYHEWMDCHE